MNEQEEPCSIFVPQPRELLHGYVYRICKLFGIRKLPHIITVSGRWCDHVKLNAEVRQVFETLTDRQLFELLFYSKKYHNYTDQRLPTKPTSFVELMNYFFYGKPYHKLWFRSRSIVFCFACICESIKQRGFGYFSGDWIKEFRYCRKHYTILLELPNNKMSTAWKNIEQILKGRIPLEAKQMSPYYMRYLFLINGDVDVDFEVDVAKENEELILAPCLQSDVINWIKINKKHLPKILEQYLADYNYRKNNPSANRFRLYDDYSFKFIMRFLMAAATECQPFREFWEQKAKFYRIYCGVRKKEGLSEEIYIRQDADCKNCHDMNWQDCAVKVAKRGYGVSVYYDFYDPYYHSEHFDWLRNQLREDA